MDFVDLHLHTTYSDGSFSPKEVVSEAKKAGIRAISITDHDITEAIPEAIEEGLKQGIEVISGVELSVELSNEAKQEMHILGYCFDWKNSQLQDTLKYFRKEREKRGWIIYDKLVENKVFLEKEYFKTVAYNGSVGRLHFAKEMLKEGYVQNIAEAFQKYLSPGKPAYVPKARLRPDEALRIILKAGGVPVIAHPNIGGYSNKNTLKSLISLGLKGIETWHSKHPASVIDNLKALANEMGLIATGGSDCHGALIDGKPLLGKLKIPYSVVEELKKMSQSLKTENILEFDKLNTNI
jgi:3',5'-nucleoside bisphosphate phosphatase